MNRLQTGFSITELLIVIVVIGILATISVVGYNGIQNRANDAAVQSDLEGTAGLLEAYRNREVGNTYPQPTTDLTTLDIRASKGSYNTTVSRNFILCASNDYKEYRIAALSKSGNAFVIGQDGFVTHTLNESSFTASLCGLFGMSLVASGMSAPNIWEGWVRT